MVKSTKVRDFHPSSVGTDHISLAPCGPLRAPHNECQRTRPRATHSHSWEKVLRAHTCCLLMTAKECLLLKRETMCFCVCINRDILMFFCTPPSKVVLCCLLHWNQWAQGVNGLNLPSFSKLTASLASSRFLLWSLHLPTYHMIDVEVCPLCL